MHEDAIDIARTFARGGFVPRNAEVIRDCVKDRCGESALVDDEPHVFEIRRNAPAYLQGEYGDINIPFPILRLGNRQRTIEALEHMRDLYQQTKDLPIPRNAPRLGDAKGADRAKPLTALLKEYEQQVELRERRECITTLADSNDNLNFTVELKSRQLARVDSQLDAMQHLDGLFEQARKLTKNDHDALMQFLLGASRNMQMARREPRAHKRRHISSNGKSTVTPLAVSSRALGVKPYSTKTEQAFLECLNHALDTIPMSGDTTT